MIFEDLLSSVFNMLSSSSVINVDEAESFYGSISTLISYIDYLDPIIPVSQLLWCTGIIIGWTIICFVIRLVIEFAT